VPVSVSVAEHRNRRFVGLSVVEYREIHTRDFCPLPTAHCPLTTGNWHWH
jgi:hypothetical protein